MHDKEITIGEGSTLRLSIVISIAVGVIGFTWWASGVQSSLNFLVSAQRGQNDTIATMKSQISTLEHSTSEFTAVGSPALRPRIQALEIWRERIEAVGSPKMTELEKRIVAIETEIAVSSGTRKP